LDPVPTVRVEDPDAPAERLTLVGLKDIVGGFGRLQGSCGGMQSPGEATIVADRLKEPERPFTLVSVINEFAELRRCIVRLVGLAETVKSRTVAVTITLCDRPPLVALTVIV
jgi:hypothetical protein